jgi:hypothetical protein
MNSIAKTMLACIAGSIVGLGVGCTLILGPFEPDPSQCWCGEQWRAQISGATAYNAGGQQAEISASATSHTRCVSMLEHLALDTADAQDPVYIALRDAFESEAISKCELAGIEAWPDDLDHTDCASTGLRTRDHQSRLSWPVLGTGRPRG